MFWVGSILNLLIRGWQLRNTPMIFPVFFQASQIASNFYQALSISNGSVDDTDFFEIKYKESK